VCGVKVVVLFQLKSLRDEHELGERFDAHFGHDAAAVDFDGLLYHAEICGDLFIWKSFYNMK
jgi:hypothetical protein